MNLQIGTARIHLEISGNDAGPVVLMAHSLGCSLQMWDPQLPALQPDYRVVRLDMRGHGDSSAPAGPYTLEQLADDVIGVMDALAIERAHWVGLSIGGMIGQSLLLRYPQRFLSAALCDTAATLSPDAVAAWDERIRLIDSGGLAAIVDATMQRWFTPSFIDADSAAFRAVRAQLLRADRDGYLGCAEAIKGLDYLDRLAGVDHPVRLIVGRDDPATPVAASRAIHERLPNSDLVVIDDASHICNVEQPDRFNDALLQFLSRRR